MNSYQTQRLLRQAHQFYGSQQLLEAESLYRQVLSIDPANRDALQALAAISLQAKRTDRAEPFLERLVNAYPAEPRYSYNYANILLQQGKTEAAITCYQRLLERQPGLADGRYNFAHLLKRIGRYDEALQQYRQALELGISKPEQVYSNIGVIHTEEHRDEEAKKALTKALAHNQDYTPALYNLALLEEELGQWEQARDLYRRILKQNPAHNDALVRLAQVELVKDPTNPLIGQLHRSLADADVNKNSNKLDQENLHFALGKVYDDCADYDQAFEHYRNGNQCARQRLSAYDRDRQESLRSQVMQTFSPAGMATLEPVSDAAPIFICGMFRSGSTLIEQILAAHPQLMAGGEIDFFNTRVPLPAALASMHPSRLHELGTSYLDYLARTFPGPHRTTNKRPDNFLYLGLIRALFPNARIINTRRHPLDNCLSVYFQQLTSQLNYASDLLDIGHYYIQYRQLMEFWLKSFAANITEIDYDQLVHEPRKVLEPLLAFLALDWDERCLKFHAVDNRVRTASVWQVRQPLYQKSSGRWRHYARQLEPLQRYLLSANIDLQ